MQDSATASDAIRCLQQLALVGPIGATAAEIARLEGLELEHIRTLLDRLVQAGFVGPTDEERFRLRQDPAEIQLADVWRALSEKTTLATRDGALTLAHLLRWEAKIFAGDAVAQAA
jgi:DNA-binding IscR family transcriptional regulator